MKLSERFFILAMAFMMTEDVFFGIGNIINNTIISINNRYVQHCREQDNVKFNKRINTTSFTDHKISDSNVMSIYDIGDDTLRLYQNGKCWAKYYFTDTMYCIIANGYNSLNTKDTTIFLDQYKEQ